MTRRMMIVLSAFAGAAVLLSTIGNDTPSYIWNASESVPIGLYRLQPIERPIVTQLVAIRPPEPLATFLDLNGYLPIGVPMLKRILALPEHLPNRAHNCRRRHRDRAGVRARWPRPIAACLAGMPSSFRRRSLCHELAVGGLF